MNNKGQAGIESVIVVAAVFLVVLVILSYYGAVSDSTIAMAIMKSNTLERLSDSDMDAQYVIVAIDYVDLGAGRIDFEVTTIPSECLENTKIDGGSNWRLGIGSKIIADTTYTIVNIDFNPGVVAC